MDIKYPQQTEYQWTTKENVVEESSFGVHARYPDSICTHHLWLDWTNKDYAKGWFTHDVESPSYPDEQIHACGEIIIARLDNGQLGVLDYDGVFDLWEPMKELLNKNQIYCTWDPDYDYHKSNF